MVYGCSQSGLAGGRRWGTDTDATAQYLQLRCVLAA